MNELFINKYYKLYMNDKIEVTPQSPKGHEGIMFK